jgi:hypothetical protein
MKSGRNIANAEKDYQMGNRFGGNRPDIDQWQIGDNALRPGRDLRRAENEVMRSVFADEQNEKTGAQWGVDCGRKRPFDQGGVRDRGAINSSASVDRLHGHGNTGGYRTRDFGAGDSSVSRRHLDGRLAKPMYSPQQSWTRPSDGAGLSSGPAWASTQRVRANSGIEYDPNEGAIYGGRNSRGPWRD